MVYEKKRSSYSLVKIFLQSTTDLKGQTQCPNRGTLTGSPITWSPCAIDRSCRRHGPAAGRVSQDLIDVQRFLSNLPVELADLRVT